MSRPRSLNQPRPAPALIGAAAAADAALIVLFAALGRDTHAGGIDLPGVLRTAAPFLIAAALAWAGLRMWRFPARLRPHGVLLWLTVALLGMGLRVGLGGGFALSFLLVTLGVLGALLLGWRLAALAVMHGRARGRSDRLGNRTPSSRTSKGQP